MDLNQVVKLLLILKDNNVNKLLIAILFSISSCTSLQNFNDRMEFDKNINSYIIDTNLTKYKTPTGGDVELIEVSNLESLPSVLEKTSKSNQGEAITQTIKFTSEESIVIFKDELEELAKEKGCNIIVYFKADNLKRYELVMENGSIKGIKTINSNGTYYFEAYFYSFIELPTTNYINLN